MNDRSAKARRPANAGVAPFFDFASLAAFAVLVSCIAWTDRAEAADAPLWPAPIAGSVASIEHGASVAMADEFANRIRNAYWRDRVCLTPACTSRRPSNLIDIASFGFAAIGGIVFARRRVL